MIMPKKTVLLDTTAALKSDSRYSTLLQNASKPRGLMARIEGARCVKQLADLYSRLLEEPVSPRRTLKFLHAQVAVLALIFPMSFPFGPRLIFLVWAALAVWQCRK